MAFSTRKDGLKWLAAISGGVLLAAAMLFSPPPARAQAPLVTPTPYPAIEATRQAAQAQLDAAQQQQAQAAQMDAQASEIRRNAEAQAEQAAQAIADARAAQAAQNAVAVGEAIGRAESDLAQLQASMSALTEINAAQSGAIKVQATQIISLTNEAAQLRVSLSNYQNVVTAQNQMIADAKQAAPSPIVPLVVGALFMLAVVGIPVIIVLQRKQSPAPQYSADVVDGEIDTPSRY